MFKNINNVVLAKRTAGLAMMYLGYKLFFDELA